MAGVIADGSRSVPANPHQPILLSGAGSLATADSALVRVATFNIHSGRGSDRRSDLSRTAHVFTTPPDILGLNEVRGSLFPGVWPDQATQLGQLLKLSSAFVPTERRWWHDDFGNGLLSRFPLDQIQKIPLSGRRGKAFRCAILARFPIQDKTVQLLAVHVDSQADREQQLGEILALFEGLRPPALLIGDLNSTADDPQMKKLLDKPEIVDPLQDSPPDARGRKHIDWILARGFRCRSGLLIQNDASDHPAAYAELELERSTTAQEVTPDHDLR